MLIVEGYHQKDIQTEWLPLQISTYHIKKIVHRLPICNLVFHDTCYF